MTVTLDQILTLSGRLDTEPGYDSARERFRRFLVEYVREWPVVRGLIEECQFSPDEQHRYALQDLIALSGSFLGFRTAFSPAAWHSRSRLHLLLDVKASPSAPAEIDTLAKAVAAAARTLDVSAARQAGLCVLSPLYVYRDKIDELAAAATVPISTASVRSVMALGDLVHAGRVERPDVIRLLESNLSIDFMIDLIAHGGVPPAAKPAPDERAAPVEHDPAVDAVDDDVAQCWLAPVAPDHATRPDEFLERVVAKRLAFGVSDDAASGSAARAGDRICFYISGRGIVGHARVASLAGGGGGLRDAHRFRQILHLQGLELFLTAPVAIDAETQLRLRTAQLAPGHKQTLVRISRDSF